MLFSLNVQSCISVEIYMGARYAVSYSMRILVYMHMYAGLIHAMGKTSWVEVLCLLFGLISSYRTTLQWVFEKACLYLLERKLFVSLVLIFIQFYLLDDFILYTVCIFYLIVLHFYWRWIYYLTDLTRHLHDKDSNSLNMFSKHNYCTG